MSNGSEKKRLYKAHVFMNIRAMCALPSLFEGETSTDRIRAICISRNIESADCACLFDWFAQKGGTIQIRFGFFQSLLLNRVGFLRNLLLQSLNPWSADTTYV